MPNQVKNILAGILSAGCILFSLGFTHLSTLRPRWGGLFPVVAFRANPAINGLHIGTSEAVMDAFRRGAGMWSYPRGGTHAMLSVSGISTRDGLLGPTALECSTTVKSELGQLEKAIFPSAGLDPDCTGPACAFVWTCGSDILHADIQINDHDFLFSDGPFADEYDIATTVSRLFGHILGLGHCAVDDPDCAFAGGSPAPDDALMSRLSHRGIILETLHGDDSAGLIDLYGTLTSEEVAQKEETAAFYNKIDLLCAGGCVIPAMDPNPLYQLTNEETAALAEHQGVIVNDGFHVPEKRKGIMRTYQDMYLSALLSTHIPVERYMLDAVNKAAEKFAEIPNTGLQGQLLMLTVNIDSAYALLNEFPEEMDGSYHAFAKAELKALILVRKALIDAMRARGVL